MFEFDYLISIMGSKLSNMVKDQMFIAAKKVLKTKTLLNRHGLDSNVWTGYILQYSFDSSTEIC